MIKKVFVALCVFSMISLVGCSKETPTKPTETQKEETTEVKEDKNEIEKETITMGTLVHYSDEEIDSYGNKEALFDDVHGKKFIAIISKDTQVDTLEVGKEYEVYHSDMQTQSLPRKLPQVSKIIEK